MGYRNKGALIILFNVILVLLSLTAVSCEPPMPFIVVNHTDQRLQIYVQHVYLGDVLPPHQIGSDRIAQIYPTWRFEAKDMSGDLVYWNELTLEEFEKMKYRVTITNKDLIGKNPFDKTN